MCGFHFLIRRPRKAKLINIVTNACCKSVKTVSQAPLGVSLRNIEISNLVLPSILVPLRLNGYQDDPFWGKKTIVDD